MGHVVEPVEGMEDPSRPATSRRLAKVSAPIGPHERLTCRARRWDCSSGAFVASAAHTHASHWDELCITDASRMWRTSIIRGSNHRCLRGGHGRGTVRSAAGHQRTHTHTHTGGGTTRVRRAARLSLSLGIPFPVRIREKLRDPSLRSSTRHFFLPWTWFLSNSIRGMMRSSSKPKQDKSHDECQVILQQNIPPTSFRGEASASHCVLSGR